MKRFYFGLVIGFLTVVALVASCTASSFVPTPSHPCPNLYCVEWQVAGVPVMVCADTQANLDAKVARMKVPQE